MTTTIPVPVGSKVRISNPDLFDETNWYEVFVSDYKYIAVLDDTQELRILGNNWITEVQEPKTLEQIAKELEVYHHIDGIYTCKNGKGFASQGDIFHIGNLSEVEIQQRLCVYLLEQERRKNASRK